MYFAADHLIEKPNKLITAINKNKSNLDEKNIFIFGIKPTSPSSEYGYFITMVIKYPYSLDGLVGFMPNINIFFSSKFDLFLLIAVINLFGFSIK